MFLPHDSILVACPFDACYAGYHFNFSMGPVDPRETTILVRTLRKQYRTNTSTI